MDCGVPFCHNGCPLGNLIPDWNDLVYRDRCAGRDRAAARDQQLPRVHRAAVPGAVRGGVRARDPRGRRGHDQTDRERDHQPRLGGGLGRARAAARARPARRSRSSARARPGMAAAQQLRRAGHRVTLFERDEAIGGLVRFGVPDFKIEKTVVERRVEQLRRRGRRAALRRGRRPRRQRRRSCASASTRSCSRPARACRATCRCRAASSTGVHFAMDYLYQRNRWVARELGPAPTVAAAAGRRARSPPQARTSS